VARHEKAMRWTGFGLVLALACTGAVLAGRAGPQGERRDADVLVTLEGKIVDAARPTATFEAGGKSYSVHLGPVRYWSEKGWSLADGDRVTVTGQLETKDGAAHLYPHRIVRRDETLVLADENGVPLWSRAGTPRGNGSGNRAGKRNRRGGCGGGCGGCGNRGV